MKDRQHPWLSQPLQEVLCLQRGKSALVSFKATRTFTGKIKMDAQIYNSYTTM